MCKVINKYILNVKNKYLVKFHCRRFNTSEKINYEFVAHPEEYDNQNRLGAVV